MLFFSISLICLLQKWYWLIKICLYPSFSLFISNLTSCSYGVDDLTSYVANIENASSIGIGSINTSNTNVKKQKKCY